MNKNIPLLKWFHFFAYFKLYTPISILYYAEVTGSYTMAMTIFATSFLSQAIFEVPTGILSDYLGRKKTITWGIIAALIAVTCYATGNIGIIYLGAVIMGFAESLYSGNNDALLHETLEEANKENEYHTFHGKITAYLTGGVAIATLFGGFIAYYLSYQWAYWFSLIPLIIATIISFKFIEPNHIEREKGNIYAHLKEAYKQIMKNKKLKLMSIGTMIDFSFGRTSNQIIQVFLQTIIPIWGLGVFRFISMSGVAISAYFTDKIIKKLGFLKTLTRFPLFLGSFQCVGIIIASVLSPILFIIASSFHGTIYSATRTKLQKEYTQKQRASMGSLVSLASTLTFCIVGISIGYIADITTPAIALIIAALLRMTQSIFFWKALKK